MAESDAERGFERFITFLDAIVAIAITLLVLPLVELTADVDEYDSVNALLRENRSELWAFLLSFLVVSRFWFAQHDSARHVVRWDRHAASILMLWAVTIVFLPFPTALMAEAEDNATTKILYIGTLIATMLFLAVFEGYLRAHPELTDADPEHDLDPVVGVVNVLMLLIALAITLAIPATSYFPILLLLAAGPIANAWRRLRGGGPRRTPVGE
ncbi:TMEM175 family protein [Nocardioides mangrovi]|uniref:TMEM175 family protein n=1 Tax=Nocardioides mangrovi TaxID=2874580 RepID=A0ABS7U6W5_9ACTN|nr:TMEM175 family protein [Nocardioides mangrovi]MBZ5736703.1 TMEM175 family protein [Nocardioides mangrovi]